MGSELKALYVLVTRARDSLVIYDRDPARAAPAMDLWMKLGLVQVRQPTNQPASQPTDQPTN